MAEEFVVQVDAILNPNAAEKIRSEIESIGKSVKPIEVSIAASKQGLKDTSNVLSSSLSKNVSNSVTKGVKDIQKSVNTSIPKNILSGSNGNRTLTRIQEIIRTTGDATGEIISLQKKIDDLRAKELNSKGIYDSKQLATFKTQREELEQMQALVYSNIGNGKYLSSTKGTQVFELTPEQKTRISRASDTGDEKVYRASNELLKNSKEIIDRYNDKSIGLENAESLLNRLPKASDRAKDSIESLRNAYNKLTNAIASGNSNTIIQAGSNFLNTQKQTIDILNKEIAAEKRVTDARKFNQTKDAGISKVDIFKDAHRNLDLATTNRLDKGVDAMKIARTPEEAAVANKYINSTIRDARAAGLQTKSWGQIFKNEFQKLGSYIGANQVFDAGISGLKNMVKNSVAVDTSMNNLQRVSGLSSVGQAKLYDKMTKSAEKYGFVLTDLIDATTTWKKLGFGADRSEKLAEISSKYAVVGDMDNAESVNNLVTAYKGFQDQLLKMSGGDQTKAISHIADVFDALGK